MASRYSIDRYSDNESDIPDIDQDRLFSFTCINMLVIRKISDSEIEGSENDDVDHTIKL